jgi:hypothetical protein
MIGDNSVGVSRNDLIYFIQVIGGLYDRDAELCVVQT